MTAPSPSTAPAVPTRRARARDMTLTHLSIMVAVVSLGAVMAVPRFLDSIERGRATEAFAYLETVHAAQERYLEQHDTYASQVIDLELTTPLPERFTVGSMELAPRHRTWRTGWRLQLTRAGGPAAMRDYTVTYDHRGFLEAESTIPASVTPLLAR